MIPDARTGNSCGSETASRCLPAIPMLSYSTGVRSRVESGRSVAGQRRQRQPAARVERTLSKPDAALHGASGTPLAAVVDSPQGLMLRSVVRRRKRLQSNVGRHVWGTLRSGCLRWLGSPKAPLGQPLVAIAQRLGRSRLPNSARACAPTNGQFAACDIVGANPACGADDNLALTLAGPESERAPC